MSTPSSANRRVEVLCERAIDELKNHGPAIEVRGHRCVAWWKLKPRPDFSFKYIGTWESFEKSSYQIREGLVQTLSSEDVIEDDTAIHNALMDFCHSKYTVHGRKSSVPCLRMENSIPDLDVQAIEQHIRHLISDSGYDGLVTIQIHRLESLSVLTSEGNVDLHRRGQAYIPARYIADHVLTLYPFYLWLRAHCGLPPPYHGPGLTEERRARMRRNAMRKRFGFITVVLLALYRYYVALLMLCRLRTPDIKVTWRLISSQRSERTSHGKVPAEFNPTTLNLHISLVGKAAVSGLRNGCVFGYAMDSYRRDAGPYSVLIRREESATGLSCDKSPNVSTISIPSPTLSLPQRIVPSKLLVVCSRKGTRSSLMFVPEFQLW